MSERNKREWYLINTCCYLTSERSKHRAVMPVRATGWKQRGSGVFSHFVNIVQDFLAKDEYKEGQEKMFTMRNVCLKVKCRY